MRICMGVLLVLYLAVAATAVAEDDLRTFKENLIETYHHADPALSISIPYEWLDLPSDDGAHDAFVEHQIISVRDKYYSSYLSVFVMDQPPELRLADSAAAAAQRDGRKLLDIRLDHLDDGTEINIGKVRDTYPLGPGVPLKSLFVSAFQNGKWILVVATKVGSEGDFPSGLKQIAYSLHFD